MKNIGSGTPVILLLSAVLAAPLRASDIPLRDWTVPSSRAPIQTLGDVTNMVAFVGLAPCRIVDTRGGAPLGGGPLAASTPRSYTITGQCGLPVNAAAASLNITVTNTSGPGYVSIWPQGGTQPVVSTLNFLGNETIANAAVVPLSLGGGVTVACMNAGCNLIVDTNGYYAAQPNSGTNGIFAIVTNGGYAMYGLNTSAGCTGTCGGFFGADSTYSGGISLEGIQESTTSRNYGVYGEADGHAPVAFPSGSTSEWAAGVWGNATSTAGGNVAGVMGSTPNPGAFSGGVVGLASGSANANAGIFRNTADNFSTYLGTEGYALLSSGNLSVGAITGTSLSISGLPKNFVSPHPLDASKEIVYAAIEGPSADVFFRGTAHLVNGSALIPVPDHFRLTAREDSYMTTVTAVGSRSTLWVESEGPDGIVVRGAGDGAFHYVVYAERDETRDQEPVRDNVHFTPRRLAGGLLKALPERTRALLVRNGTLNADGTFNEATADRLGWVLPTTEQLRAGTVK